MAKSDRKGHRRSREAARKRPQYLANYLIVTDTAATERNYFEGLRHSLPVEIRNKLIIKVVNAKKTKTIVEECKKLLSNDPQPREPWLVFDKDDVKNFDEIISEAEKNDINVGWSNPCIEVWFNAYFGKLQYYETSIKCWHKFAEQFKNISGREYDKADASIYQFLSKYGDESKALAMAEKRFLQDIAEYKKPSEMNPGTTVYRLVKDIRKKTSI